MRNPYSWPSVQRFFAPATMLVLLVALFSMPANAQITASVSGDNTLCVGESSQLTASAVSGFSAAMFDDFDGGINGALWANNSGISNTDCGSVSGDALHFDIAGAREAETNDFDVSNGGDITFALVFGLGVAPCETADLGEDVEFEYSIDGGATWNLISTYITTSYQVWTNISEAIPAAAQTASTRFRWTQPNHSGLDFDAWALDNVDLSNASPTAVGYTWSPASGLSATNIANPVATPAATTTYQVIAFDTISATADTVDITITVGATFTISTSVSPGSVCLLEDIQASATVSPAGTYSYAWTGGGTFSDPTIANPVISPTASGTVWFYCEVTSATGCAITDSVSATVSTNPIPILSVGGDLTPCGTDSTQLQALALGSGVESFDGGLNLTGTWGNVTGTSNTNCGSVTGDALHFQHAGQREAQTLDLNFSVATNIDFWLYLGNGTAPCETADAGENVVLEYSNDGGATWVLINTYLAGAYTVFTQISEPLPAAAQTASTRVRWRQTANSGQGFDAWAIDDVTIPSGTTAGYNFTWSPATGLSSTTISNPMASVTTATTYTVVAADQVSGCSDTTTVTVTPATDFTYSTAFVDTFLCINEPEQAVISAVGGTFSYLWTADPNITFDDDTLFNPVITPGASGTYTLYYEIASTSGCVKNDSLVLTVDTVPVAILTMSGDPTPCLGDTTQLSVAVDVGQNANDYLYQWSPTTALSTSTGATTLANPTTPITYVVDVLAPGAGCVSQDSITVTPAATFTVATAPSSNTVCIGEPVTITTTLTPAGAASYQWSGDGNVVDDTLANPTVILTDVGFNTVVYSIESAAGCLVVDSLLLLVANGYFPTVIVEADTSVCVGDSVQINTTVFGGVNLSDNFDTGIDAAVWASNDGLSDASCGAAAGANALYFNTTGVRSAESIDMNTLGGGTVDFELYLGNGFAPCETADFNEDVSLEYSNDGGTTWVNINTYLAGAYPNFTLISEAVPTAAQTTATRFRFVQFNNSGAGFDNWAIDEVVFPLAPTSAYTYTWTPAATLNDPTSPNPIAGPASSTTYTVIVADSSNTCADTVTVPVVLVPSFTYTSSVSDTSVCAAVDVTLDIVPTPAGTYSYAWTGNAIFSDSSVANPTATMANSGSIDLEVLIATALGCEKTEVLTVNVANAVVPVAGITGDTTVCGAESNQWFATTAAACPGGSDDFNAGISGTLWANNTGVDNTDCGAQTGNALHFNDATSRVAETIDLDMTCGGDIEFYLYLGTGTGTCETADFGEDVNLEFSIDGGATWSVMQTYLAGAYANFTLITETMPVTAQTSATRFRWIQNNFSGVNFDNWAIDDVVIGNGGGGSSEYVFSWSPASLVTNPNDQNPFVTTTQDTIITLIISDSTGSCFDTTSYPLYLVPDFTYVLTASDTGVCLQEDVQLNVATTGTGTFTYVWNPASLLDDTTITNPLATMNAAGTHVIDLLMSNGLGCEKTDSVVIGVSGGQTPVIAITGDLSVCTGDSTQLEVINTSVAAGVSDNFDAGINGAMWTTNTGVDNTDCGSVAGNALHMNAANRVAETIDMDFSGGGMVDFNIIFGSGGAPCENADAGESVDLDYSIDGGATWVTMNTYVTTGPFDVWTFVSEAVPAAAQTGSTRFRWIQNAFSGVGNDNWALDDVAITPISASAYTYDWTPTAGVNTPNVANPWITPTANTTYTVIMTDSIGGCADTTSATLTLTPTFTYVLTASDTGVCLQEDVQLNVATTGTGTFTYAWSPADVLDDSTITNPVATLVNSGANVIEVVMSNGLGCEKTDSLVVNVSGNTAPSISITGDLTVCVGDSTQLTIVNANAGSNASDNFDAGINTAMWATNTGVDNTDCGSVAGNALHMNAANRVAETIDLNVPGGSFDFNIIFGSGGAPCEDADAGESVDFDYSIDGGATWVNINTYVTTGAFDSWTFVSEPIPAAAQTGSTRFRWIQNAFSGTGTDNWALDEVALNTSSSAAYIYSWMPSIGVNTPDIANPWITPPGDTTYTAVMTDSVGGCSDTTSVFVQLVPVFAYTATSSDSAVCLLEDVQFTVATTGAGTFSYEWEPAAIMNDSSLANPVGTMASSGPTTVIYSMDNGLGCQQTDSLVVLVSNNETPDISIVGDTVVCIGDSTQLEVFNATGIETIEDDFDAGISGTMWANITGTDNTDCGSVAGNALHMNAANRFAETIDLDVPPGATVDFNIVFGSGAAPCENADAGESVDLEYSTDGGATWVNMNTYVTTGAFDNWTFVSEAVPAVAQTGSTRFRWIQNNFSGVGNDNWALDEVAISIVSTATYFYSWSPAIGVNTPDIANPWITPPNDTLYTVMITDSVGGCSDTTTVNVGLAPNFTYALSSSDSAVCLNETVQLEVVVSPAGTYNYAWTPANVLDDTTIFNPLATLNTPGPITFNVLIDNGLGCEKEDSAAVVVGNGPQPSVSVLTANAVLCAGDSIQLEIDVTPNDPCEFTLQMYDTFGDGWNGASINAFANGVFIGNYAATGDSLYATIPVPVGDTLTLNYSAGAFENEVSYILVNAFGEEEFADGPFPATGLVFTTIANCSQTYNTVDLGFTWIPATGVNDPNSTNPWVTPLTDTTYSIVVIDTIGGCSDTASWSVDVAPSFTPNVIVDDSIVCPVTDVGLLASPVPAGTYTYTWTDNEGLLNTLTGAQVIAGINSPGTHEFNVEIDNGLGCVKDIDATVTGSMAPIPTLSSPGTIFVCLADTAEPGIELLPNQDVTCYITLDMADATGDGWDGAEVRVLINGAPYDTVWVEDGNTTASLQVPFAFGDAVTMIYTGGNSEFDNSLEVFDASGNSVYAAGPNPTTGPFYQGLPQCSDPDLYTYTWTPATGLSDSTILDPIIPAPTSGTYTVIISDPVGGCSDTASVTLNVSGPLDATITSGTSFCSNDGFVVPTSVDAGGTWLINGNVFTDSISLDTLSFGTHELIYTIPGGCGDADSLTFTSAESPGTPVFGSDSICEGDSFTLQPDGGNTTEYFADAALTNSVGVAPVSIVGAATTDYYGVVTATNGCTSDAGTQTVAVWAAPTPGAIAGPTTVQTLTTVDYSVTDDPTWNYTWWIDNGNITGGFGTANISVLWGAVGVGIVNLVVTSADGCESDTLTLDADINPVGLGEGSRGGFFSLQPNPFRTATKVQFANPNGVAFKAELFDQSGRLVRTLSNVRGEQLTIERAALASGIYHLRLTGDQLYNGRLVIQD